MENWSCTHMKETQSYWHCGMLAVREGEREIVKMLVDRGIDIFKPNSSGKRLSDYLDDNDERILHAKALIKDKLKRDRKEQQRLVQEEQEAERDRLNQLEVHLKQEQERILQEAREKGRILQEEESRQKAQLEQIRQLEADLQEARQRFERESREEQMRQQKRQDSEEYEIDPKSITILKKLGSGNFGEVYLGTWDDHPVALKKLADESQVQEFFKEVRAIKSIQHPNIVRFYGVAKIGDKLNLVTEFCNGGSLFDHLRKISELSQKAAVAMALGIAKGVAALHVKNIVHRDLAARNVLLSFQENDLVIKVADFGMSRKIDSSYYQTKPEAPMPIRWSAPEVLSAGKFSPASDVWSFGITVWEIYELDGVPYGGFDAEQASKNIVNGMKLMRPDLCTDDRIWNIIENCWKSRAMERPTMVDIANELKEIYDAMPDVVGDNIY
eukprot:TRINITY_DN525_c0_g2_i9.p1 TRINITY_DN525_c0_g2~~TRINITY_DN525_c0_g2_i9.p1  ORF type:complete len:442 (+),score=152.53 TRINITY_DN525_c0_g2_i9:268-1593(+)